MGPGWGPTSQPGLPSLERGLEGWFQGRDVMGAGAGASLIRVQECLLPPHFLPSFFLIFLPSSLLFSPLPRKTLHLLV